MTQQIRRVLVTGGNKGIGKALCSQILANYGDTHVLLGSRDESRGLTAVQDILKEIGEENSSRLEWVKLDVVDDSSVKAAAELVREKYGSDALYGLLNNAGVVSGATSEVLDVNFFGVRRVCDAFIPLMRGDGRVVNMSSGSAPMYVAKLSESEKQFFDTHGNTSWEPLLERIEKVCQDPESSSVAYGFSKACLNVYTMQLAQSHPQLLVNSVSPGLIDTDLLRTVAASRMPWWVPGPVAQWFSGTATQWMGSKPPSEGTKSSLHCLFGEADVVGSGKYFGSDGVRSPLSTYRSPGSPPYVP